ncbi:hypothetical protein [Fusobacterium hwasookii]|nr:hypothetical protein [Fusobacterium hwasookii]
MKKGVKKLKILNLLGLFKSMKTISTSLLVKTLIKVAENNKNNKEK